tara:strand:- start:101 stop:343 length:243 start_codon:yes stop_codon:yes gene_type:complete
MNQSPTPKPELALDFAQLRTVQRYWNNQLIRTFAAALDAVDDDDDENFNRQFKRLAEIEMRRRKDYELPFNDLVGEKAYK